MNGLLSAALVAIGSQFGAYKAFWDPVADINLLMNKGPMARFGIGSAISSAELRSRDAKRAEVDLGFHEHPTPGTSGPLPRPRWSGGARQ